MSRKERVSQIMRVLMERYPDMQPKIALYKAIRLYELERSFADNVIWR